MVLMHKIRSDLCIQIELRFDEEDEFLSVLSLIKLSLRLRFLDSFLVKLFPTCNAFLLLGIFLISYEFKNFR